MNITRVINYYVSILNNLSENAELDAVILLSRKKSDNQILLKNKQLRKAEIQKFRNIFILYIKGISVQKLRGRVDFLDLKLLLSKFTLVPRPETEMIPRWVSNKFSNCTELDILDIGSGSGSLSISMSLVSSKWKVEALDISPEALYNSRINAFINKVQNLKFFVGFLCKDNQKKTYDIIVSNPPYVNPLDTCLPGLYDEPVRALISSKHGMNFISMIARKAKKKLKHSGTLILEHSEKNSHIVRDILSSSGYINMRTHKDLLGNMRFTVAENTIP